MIKVFIEGIIIGVAKILPGISGAFLAMLFGQYEIIINSIASIKYANAHKETLVPLSIGIITSVIITSTLLNTLINSAYHVLLSFIIGIMLYEVLIDLKRYKNTKIKYKYIIISLLIILFLSSIFLLKGTLFNVTNSTCKLILLFICGILDAFATIVPGVSGTALLILVGSYRIIISGISNADLSVILPFGIGLIIGLIFFAKIISNMLKKYSNFIHYCVVLFCCIRQVDTGVEQSVELLHAGGGF